MKDRLGFVIVIFVGMSSDFHERFSEGICKKSFSMKPNKPLLNLEQTSPHGEIDNVHVKSRIKKPIGGAYKCWTLDPEVMTLVSGCTNSSD